MMTNKKTTFVVPTIIVMTLALLWWLVPIIAEVKAVYLWTDRLIFVLITALIYLISYIRTKAHLRMPWREVFHRKLAMVALVVLCVYVVIGLLDSIHFREPLTKKSVDEETHYSVEVLSVFDVLASGLRERTEETYSAPFAAYSHAKKTVETALGEKVRKHPRLRHGGRHLSNPEEDKVMDILTTVLKTSVVSLLVWLVIIMLWIVLLARKNNMTFKEYWSRIWSKETLVPWHVIFYSIAVVLLIGMAAIRLSADYHIFGTDKVGQDVFYLALKSIRTGLVIGTLTTLIMLPFALFLGIMAGYHRGWVDDVIQYVYTTLNSIPGILLIAAAILSIDIYLSANPDLIETVSDKSDLRLLALCVILGITSWTGLCRLLRGESMKIREVDYIQAATAFGVRHFNIMTRHIMPNVMHIVLIAVVLDFSGLVLAEAVLSYIGVGVDQSTISWGNMINSARLELAREPMVWWSLCAAFVMMFTLVLAANLFSDAVRDAFDPRLKQLVGT